MNILSKYIFIHTNQLFVNRVISSNIIDVYFNGVVHLFNDVEEKLKFIRKNISIFFLFQRRKEI